MYAEILESLTAEDRKMLAERGVPSSRVSEWKTGFRVPTRPQTLVLADLKGIDPMTLERELMVIETEKEAKVKPMFRGIIDRMKPLITSV